MPTVYVNQQGTPMSVGFVQTQVGSGESAEGFETLNPTVIFGSNPVPYESSTYNPGPLQQISDWVNANKTTALVAGGLFLVLLLKGGGGRRR